MSAERYLSRVLPSHLYVHVPFCARRCSYCDFAIAVRASTPVDAYLAGLDRELGIRFPDSGGWSLDTLYLGGGTPSRLGADGIARLMALIQRRAILRPGAEVTIEANPDDVSAGIVAAWRDAGVTRVSLGAQSFDDRALAWMHRTHDSATIGRAAAALQSGGIDNWSLDLIFALPESLGRDWPADLGRAMALAPPHISLYGLTFEPHTPLQRWGDRGQVVEAPDERYADEYARAHETLSREGYVHYEVSNFARPGRESKHNRCYWSGAAYVGCGPAAHGFDGTSRRWNEPAYARWIDLVARGIDPRAGEETLSVEDSKLESIYLGLRTSAGADLSTDELAIAAPLIREGWATRSGERLTLTAEGWLRLDEITATLTGVRSH
jgi:oxygen-independent coproporphyrinogen-3 oxidase